MKIGYKSVAQQGPPLVSSQSSTDDLQQLFGAYSISLLDGTVVHPFYWMVGCLLIPLWVDHTTLYHDIGPISGNYSSSAIGSGRAGRSVVLASAYSNFQTLLMVIDQHAMIRDESQW